MTLLRQLLIVIITTIIVLLLGSFVLSGYNAKVLVEEQMRIHAQDTATSLAISITQAVAEDDQAELDTLFNAVSDLGYYQQIYFIDLNNNRVIERYFQVNLEGVPQFFVDFIDLPALEGRAEVSSGWMRLGDVIVVSHPGQAYRQLWHMMAEQAGWYLLALLILVTAGVMSVSVFLKPLSRVEHQANAICEQDFVTVNELPKTRELKRVVEAMNRMATRLKVIFEDQVTMISQLQARLYRDSVTGVSSREHFDARLKAFVNSESGGHNAGLFLLAIAQFDKVNELVGRAEGNQLLKRIGELLTELAGSNSGAVIARRQGAQFSVFVPDIEEETLEQLAEQFYSRAAGVEWAHKLEHPLTLFMGCVYREKISSASDLLSAADLALNHISTTGVSGWVNASKVLGEIDPPVLRHSVEEWRALLTTAIENKRIKLVAQQVCGFPKTKIAGYEIYARVMDGDSMLSAGIVVPLLERFGLVEAFDKAVFELLSESPQWHSLKGFLGVNICTQSLGSESFMQWMRDFLQANKSLATRLVVEVPEHALRVNEAAVRELDGILLSRGARLAIDHFGLESSSFAYLGNLPLAYIKIHQSFVHDVESSPEGQFYIKSLAQVAHSRDMELYVEGVENEREWKAIKALGVDGVQGYYLQAPDDLASFT